MDIKINRCNFHQQTYVQDLLEAEGAEVCKILIEEGGHIYICGDCKMAEGVQQKLKGIIQKNTNKSEDEVSEFIVTLMVGDKFKFITK